MRMSGGRHGPAVGKGGTMNGSTSRVLRAAVAAGAAVLLTAGVATADSRKGERGKGRQRAEAHQRYDRHHHQDRAGRVDRQSRHDRRYTYDRQYRGTYGPGRVAPAPPLPPRPRALPRLGVMAVPHSIHVAHRHRYSPYYAGQVLYGPRGIGLDVYYFPVRVGARVLYQPYYYLDGELFFSNAGGHPRFYFQLGF